MSREYEFIILKYQIEATSGALNKNVIVQTIMKDKNEYFDFYFVLNFDRRKDSKQLVKNFSIMYKDLLDSAEEHRKHSEVFLMGYFGFKTINDVKNAINNLKNKFNGINTNKILPKKWSIFEGEFRDWFVNKLKPSTLEEIKLYKFLFNESHNIYRDIQITEF